MDPNNCRSTPAHLSSNDNLYSCLIDHGDRSKIRCAVAGQASADYDDIYTVLGAPSKSLRHGSSLSLDEVRI